MSLNVDFDNKTTLKSNPAGEKKEKNFCFCKLPSVDPMSEVLKLTKTSVRHFTFIDLTYVKLFEYHKLSFMAWATKNWVYAINWSSVILTYCTICESYIAELRKVSLIKEKNNFTT